MASCSLRMSCPLTCKEKTVWSKTIDSNLNLPFMRLLVKCSFQLQSKDECFFKNYGIQTIFYAFQTRPELKRFSTLAIFFVPRAPLSQSCRICNPCQMTG